VDWETVKNVEVVKGLVASLYGTSATGGIINITTKDGGSKPVNSSMYASAGSNGFRKILGQVDGTQGNVNYRISYSHVQSHGYRVHQASMAYNLSEKLTWTPSKKIKVIQLLTYTSYFNQNSEGINLSRYDMVGHKAANTDAIRYNEFHKTQRLTGATIVRYDFAKNQDITVKGFIRLNNYQETSNNGDDFKPYVNQGKSAQYNLHFGKENLFNHLSLGVDYQSMKMTEHLFAVPDGDHINNDRVDNYWSEEVFDLNTTLINQVIRQRSTRLFLIDKLDIAKKLYALLNVRYDYVYNRLDSSTVSDNKTFQKPSTSMGGELGVRGEVGKSFYYDVTGFLVNSKDEFYRYRVPGRGNNTAFYGNMGASKRWVLRPTSHTIPLTF